MKVRRVVQDAERPRVALLIETSTSYGRGVLRGIARYLRKCGPWSIFLEQRELNAKPPSWLYQWDGDGIIARFFDPGILKIGAPMVVLSDCNPTGDWFGLPRVGNDNIAVGRLAVEHLIERRFKSFGYYGVAGEYWSDIRQRGVRETLEGVAGARCEFFALDAGQRSQDWESRQNTLAEWITSLRRPLGLIACNDIHGRDALDACRRARLAVPEEVAVIGVDNDEEMCSFSDPPLSSIAFDRERVGYEAAALLDRLMIREGPPSPVRAIPPLGEITRQSTDVLAITDPHFAHALHFIRRRACSGIDVASVIEQLPISRRSLEQRFERLLGRSLGAEIQRVRIERAKTLLAETDLPVEVIGRRTGFSTPAYFSTAFKRQTGETPTMYRLLKGPSAIAPASSFGG